jgi:uncharacterized protein
VFLCLPADDFAVAGVPDRVKLGGHDVTVPTGGRRSALGLHRPPARTVDKFQGREAPVVFYSMAISSAEDIPRSLNSSSRAIDSTWPSRAMCLAFVVASPRLLESRARTIERMRLINALCRFVERAEARDARV